MPGSPGSMAASACLDVLRDLRGVRRRGTARPPASGSAGRRRDASPISGWWSSTTVATSPSRRARPSPLDRDAGPGRPACVIGEDVLDAEPLVRRLDESARARGRRLDEAQRRHPQRVAGRLDHLRQGDVAGAQLLRVDLDLQLAVPLAPDRRRWRRPGCPSAAAGSSSGRAPTDRSGRRPSTGAPIISDAAGRGESAGASPAGLPTLRQRVRLGQALLHHLAGLVAGRCPARRRRSIDERPGHRLGADRRRATARR